MVGPIKRTDDLLTEEQRECLDLLAEEANEIALAVSKMKRFGVTAIGEDGTEYDNARDLSLEVGDLNFMVGLAHKLGMIKLGAINEGIRRKETKIVKYARYLRWP